MSLLVRVVGHEVKHFQDNPFNGRSGNPLYAILLLMRGSWLAAIGVGIWLAVPPPALAVEPGVIVDPDDPAGVEYAIPLESARGDAAGGQSAGDRALGAGTVAANWPLFGIGITRSRLAGADGRSNPATRSDDSANDSVGGVSATLWSVGIPAAVLLAGLMLGLALRRSSDA